jgi:outer membrane biosynthesis protein TonB
MFSQDLLTSIVETAIIAVPCLYLLDMAAKIESLTAKLDQVVETLATQVPQAVETQVPETQVPETQAVETQVPEAPAKKRGRPKGSKNKPKVTQVPEVVQTQVPETQVPETQVPETQVTDAGLAEATAPSPAYQAPAPAETVRSKTKTRASYKATQDKALVVKTEPTGRIVTTIEARGLCKTQEVLAKINNRWCRVTGVGSTTVSCTRGVWANHDQVTAWLAIG